MFRMLDGFGVEGYGPICMDSNDSETMVCGFAKRLLRDVPLPKADTLMRLKVFVTEQVQVLERVTPLGLDEWLDSTTYSQSRKDQLRAAYESLNGRPPSSHDLHKVKTFMKVEFYTEWKHARMINPRVDAVMVFLALRFKAIERVVYATPDEGTPFNPCTMWDVGGHKESWFIKHVPVGLRYLKIALLSAAGYRLFATDFTAYESHFTPEIMAALEVVLYKHCLAGDQGLGHVLRAITGKNRLGSRIGITATVPGRRMSGDSCTSLGNGFSNLMLVKFICHERGLHCFGFVEGDDGLFAVNGDLLASDYADLGFTIKIDEPKDPLTAGFCGMVYSATGQNIKNPRKFFQGFGWTHNYITAGKKVMMELLRAKALSAVYETPHCPIIGVLARRALTATRRYNPRFVNDGYHMCPDESGLEPFAPTVETRELFAVTYGVSIADQLVVEDLVSKGCFNRIQQFIPPQCVDPGAPASDYSLAYIEVD